MKDEIIHWQSFFFIPPMTETITAVKAKPQETWWSQQVFHVLMTKRTIKSVSLHSVPLFSSALYIFLFICRVPPHLTFTGPRSRAQLPIITMSNRFYEHNLQHVHGRDEKLERGKWWQEAWPCKALFCASMETRKRSVTRTGGGARERMTAALYIKQRWDVVTLKSFCAISGNLPL